ncbi:MAG TPA: alpha/beta fold hydrolase [Candidatus Methylomirabilis sp.]|nr:alpha/beta fold hydrolase [Candidatus Methylomirabilis sp.]
MIAYPLEVGTTVTRVIQSGLRGEPIVLIHGVGARADRWRRNVDPLAALGYRVYAIDLPGHGFAKKGKDFAYSIAGYAAFVEDFLEEIDAPRAVLIGTSLGGHIAAALACRRPELVRALVLVGSLGLLPVGAETRGRMRGGIVNTTREGIRQKLLRVNFDPANVTEELVEEEYRVNNSPGADDALTKLAEYFAERIDDDVVGQSLAALTPRLPTLLVWGAEERSVAVSVGETAASMLPAARLVLLRDSAHGPYLEKAEAFNAVVGDFLAGALGATKSPDIVYR